VEPLFDWYYPLQMGCALVALGTALAWRGGKLNLGRQIVLGLALVTVVVGWWLEHKVSELRGPRNELTNRVLSSATEPDAELLRQTEAARATFRDWHNASLLVNMLTVLLVTAAMSLAAWLPAKEASLLAR